MVMEYEVLSTEDPNYWLVRIYGNNELCGKWRLETAVKDAFTPKLDELGWTERT